MALIPEAVGSLAGTLTGARAAAAGDTMNTGDDVQLVVQNGSGASITVTIVCKQMCNMGASSPTHDSVTTVAAGATRTIGPVNNRFKDPVSGVATVNYSATASVNVYATRV